jgi:hypothetical protein
MEERNAWLKDWGKRLREGLAACDCGPVDTEIQRLLDELEKRETHAAPDTPNESSPPSTCTSTLPTIARHA